jgi:hypothetical protein
MKTISEIQQDLGTDSVTLYGHKITTSEKRVLVQPATTPVVWVPTRGEAAEVQNFSSDSLGQWLPSQEQEENGKNVLAGFVRPCFEVKSLPGQAGGSCQLNPDNQSSANPLYLFTAKKIEIGAGEVMALA